MSADNLRTRHPELLRFIEEARHPMSYHKDAQWTDEQLLASHALAVIVGGFHNLPKIRECGRGVEANIYDGISTWDGNRLTRAVLVAHQMGVRIEICASGPGRIKLIAHARFTSDDKDCGLEFWERHPSLDYLAELCGKWKLPAVTAEPAEINARYRDLMTESEAQLAAAIAERDELRRERDDLKAWKESALAVESEWDVQELAKMLGAKPGQSCRRAIHEGALKLLHEVDSLKRERDEAREENARLRAKMTWLAGQLTDHPCACQWLDDTISELLTP